MTLILPVSSSIGSRVPVCQKWNQFQLFSKQDLCFATTGRIVPFQTWLPFSNSPPSHHMTTLNPLCYLLLLMVAQDNDCAIFIYISVQQRASSPTSEMELGAPMLLIQIVFHPPHARNDFPNPISTAHQLPYATFIFWHPSRIRRVDIVPSQSSVSGR